MYTKIKVLAPVNEKLMPKSEIANTLNMSKSTFFTIIKNHDSILRIEEIRIPVSRSRLRERKFQQ